MELQIMKLHELRSFKEYLFKVKQNKLIIITAMFAVVIQFLIFKYYYPFASYIHGDSFVYLTAAQFNLDVNTYMIGYSRFLRIFSVFSKSDFFLVAFQYLLLQGSVLTLLFTAFYFYKPSWFTRIILLLFMVFNPLFLHLGNLVSSDCLFASLSFIWFTLLLWVLHAPSKKIVILHAFVLLFAFTVRYNGLIYPFISLLAFLFCGLPFRKKVMGLFPGLIFCLSFILFTSYSYKKLTGYFQYSPFSGWQLANNAMYAYRYVKTADRKPVEQKFQVLDKMIREYFDSTRDIQKNPSEGYMASTYYMWSPGMPLFVYRNNLFRKDTLSSELKKWATMGPFYKSYGIHIIEQYPFHFFKYYVWPNANKYYAPPVEFLDHYNSGRDSVENIAQVWFGYKKPLLTTRFKDKSVSILNFYPILSGIINVVMLFALTFYLLLKGWKNNHILMKGIIMGASFWLANAFFTITASSAALRFQTFPIMLTTTFVFLLIDWLATLAMVKNENEKKEIDLQNIIVSKANSLNVHG